MNWSDVLKAVIPVIVASLAWLLGQVADFSTRLTKIEGSMPALIAAAECPRVKAVCCEGAYSTDREKNDQKNLKKESILKSACNKL